MFFVFFFHARNFLMQFLSQLAVPISDDFSFYVVTT